jgi:hypothetical protein
MKQDLKLMPLVAVVEVTEVAAAVDSTVDND